MFTHLHPVQASASARPNDRRLGRSPCLTDQPQTKSQSFWLIVATCAASYRSKGSSQVASITFCIVVCATSSSQARGWRERNCARLRLQIGATPERVTCSPDLLGWYKLTTRHTHITNKSMFSQPQGAKPDVISILIHCISQIFRSTEMCSKSTE